VRPNKLKKSLSDSDTNSIDLSQIKKTLTHTLPPLQNGYLLLNLVIANLAVFLPTVNEVCRKQEISATSKRCWNRIFTAPRSPNRDPVCVSACGNPTMLLKEAGLRGSYDCVELAHNCAGESHSSWPRVPRAIVMRLMRSAELRTRSSLRMSSIIVFNCSTMSFEVPKMSILL
jgi:hypothetical protein